ncbi:Lnb N-terminal periplasmic domain-containing protein [[Pseudomonas] boreopolis]|uniref:Lnb N-terminal periplasmic domain-containing protein n=1 Tax=Xanthomonas boreopolis TaxID=86183 RepID=UPI003D3E9A10
MTPALRRAGRWALRVAVVAAGAWSLLSMYFLIRHDALLRWATVAIWAGLTAAALWGLRRGRENWALPGIFALAFAGLQYGWWSMQPSQDRAWADDVAERLRPELHGSRVVLHNVRDFDWRGEDDYGIRWETREYDLDRLASADLALSYWMGPAIAHTLVSFGFDDGSHVVFSLEIRKERGESFSALGGFFRMFEETLVAADERDILRVRTNARGEDMHLYRLDIPREGLRKLFVGYLERARELDQAPRFYNTLTSNCTTIVFELARQLDPGLPLDWRLLASGYLAEYAFDQHGLLPGYTFDQLERGGHITARARAADRDPDFSARIRPGMPLRPAQEVR